MPLPLTSLRFNNGIYRWPLSCSVPPPPLPQPPFHPQQNFSRVVLVVQRLDHALATDELLLHKLSQCLQEPFLVQRLADALAVDELLRDKGRDCDHREAPVVELACLQVAERGLVARAQVGSTWINGSNLHAGDLRG
jgi:hypothetical protein